MFIKLIVSLSIILVLVSCNSPEPKELSSNKQFKTYISEKFEKNLEKSSKITIAVMPISKKKLSADMADYFRKVIMDKLKYKGYSLINPKTLDKALLKFGQETPSQIKSIGKKGLRELTSADYLLYSTMSSDSREGKIFYSGSLVLKDLNKEDMWSCTSNLNIEKKEGIDPLSLVVDSILSGGGAALGILFDIGKADAEIKKGVIFFTDSLLSSLPDGSIEVELIKKGNGLLNSATEIKVK